MKNFFNRALLKRKCFKENWYIRAEWSSYSSFILSKLLIPVKNLLESILGLPRCILESQKAYSFGGTGWLRIIYFVSSFRIWVINVVESIFVNFSQPRLFPNSDQTIRVAFAVSPEWKYGKRLCRLQLAPFKRYRYVSDMIGITRQTGTVQINSNN